jgi:5-formyltetrahydrofolate cyclo-ligase
MDKQSLRQQIKSERRQLTRLKLKRRSLQLLRLTVNYKPFRQSRRIAFYFGVAGEMDPGPLLEAALQSGKTPYLPILRSYPANRLWFAPYSNQSRLIPNRFGIPEPSNRYRQLTMPWSLDMVFVPLVAFDPQGHRLGMGGGYYDRTFAFKRLRTHLKGPKLIGLAHEFQYRPHLHSNPWDIPLDAVITESSLYTFPPA